MSEPKALKEPKDDKGMARKVQEWWWDVTRNSWFEKRVQFPWYDLKKGLRNIAKWFPLVWRDRDWGYDSILRTMQFKIRNTSRQILKNNIIRDEDQQRIKRYCDLCCRLIDRYCDEFYEMEYLDYHKSDFIWDVFEDDELPKGTKQLRIVDREDNLDQYFSKYPHDYRRTMAHIARNFPDRDPKDSDNRVFVAIVMSGLRQQKANSLLWKILDKELRFWWD